MIYLDSAATSLHRPPEVSEAVCAALTTMGNPGRGFHAPTLNAARMVYDTREQLAALLGIHSPERIAFTANATEALNMAISGLITPEDHAITAVDSHNSVLRPLYRKEDEGTHLTILSADELGRVDISQLEGAFRPNTRCVVLTHASNLTGNVNDITAAAAIAHQHGAVLIVDASQTAGAIPIDADAMGVDVLCFTGHKSLLGPQGTGGIYVREGLQLPSFKVGGSGVHSYDREHPAVMPTSLEAGTLNVHAISGLNAAVRWIQAIGVDAIHQREMTLVRRFVDGISALENVRLYGDINSPLRAPIISLNIGTLDSARVSEILWDEAEICVRAGAHCAPLMHRSLGTEQQGAVRFSFSYFNTESEIDTAVQVIREIAEEANACE